MTGTFAARNKVAIAGYAHSQTCIARHLSQDNSASPCAFDLHTSLIHQNAFGIAFMSADALLP